MKLLTDFPEDEKFYRGTIIVIKNAYKSPKGNFDIKYAMVGMAMSNDFKMLDLHRSIGGCILKDLKCNVEGHVAVNKQGIYNWVKEYFELFYTPEGQAEWLPKLNDVIFIEDLDDYFVQANRDLFIK